MPLHPGARFLPPASNAGSHSCCLRGCRILGKCFTESSFIDVIAQLCIALKPSILFSKLTLNNFHLNDDSLMRVRKKRKKPACTTLFPSHPLLPLPPCSALPNHYPCILCQDACLNTYDRVLELFLLPIYNPKPLSFFFLRILSTRSHQRH